MTEKQAKKQLSQMLGSFTTGSVLHLLADVISDIAEEAQSANDQVRFQQLKHVESTLTVVGMGIDAACPI